MPITFLNCPCVTSVAPSQNGFVNVTAATPSPIVNVPAGISINFIPTEFASATSTGLGLSSLGLRRLSISSLSCLALVRFFFFVYSFTSVSYSTFSFALDSSKLFWAASTASTGNFAIATVPFCFREFICASHISASSKSPFSTASSNWPVITAASFSVAACTPSSYACHAAL